MFAGHKRLPLVLLIAVAGLGPCLGFGTAASADAAAPKPNIVLVRTDDQSLATFTERYMPQTLHLFEKRGTFFSNSIVSDPQCCPSRAAAMTGQYSHNNGVVANHPGYSSLRDKRNVLPTWLRRAGYRTIHVGKFLNGWEAHGLQSAPGWDRWLNLQVQLYLRPLFVIDGHGQQFQEYLGDVTARMTQALIRRYAPKRKPFFLALDEYAPHVSPPEGKGSRCAGAAIPDPDEPGLFASEKAPHTAAWDEADVSDKPEYIRRLPRIGAGSEAEIDRKFGCAAASLHDVDRNFAEMVALLREAGELDNTMIVFTSDNGYAFGEHRMPFGKGLPYEEHLRVPLAVMPPASFPRSARTGGTVEAAVSNVDMAPTFLDLAGAEPCARRGKCRRMDGRSYLPLLEGRRPGWSRGRAIQTSFDIGASNYKLSCVWDGLWRPDESVIEHTSLPVGTARRCSPAHYWEAYDTAADPGQLDAQAATAAQKHELERLRRCSGIAGRDKRIAGVPFCE